MTDHRPSVLFVCVKNGGKSQMAAALMRQVAGGEIDVYSAGTAPGTALNAQSEESIREVGASFEGEYPKPIDPEVLGSVDRVVIIGAEAQMDTPAEVATERWETDEPSKRGIEGAERMNLIRDELATRVASLRTELLGQTA